MQANEVNITRTFNAPRQLVFRAWIDSDMMARWWGPEIFTNPVVQLDAKQGGKIYIQMKAPDGAVFPMTGTFDEIDEPNKLVFSTLALDTNNQPIFDVQTTVLFADEGDKTKLTLTAKIIKQYEGMEQYASGMEQGWNGSFDRLAKIAEAEKDKNLFITRTFNAPRELVFDAWSSAEHLEKWYCPDGCTIKVKAFDFKEGVPFHHCIVVPNFKDCWCIGTFLTINRPHRLVYTLINADENGNEIQSEEAGFEHEWPNKTTVTITFTEEAGKTKMVLHQTASEELAKRTGAYPSWLNMFDRLDKIY